MIKHHVILHIHEGGCHNFTRRITNREPSSLISCRLSVCYAADFFFLSIYCLWIAEVVTCVVQTILQREFFLWQTVSLAAFLYTSNTSTLLRPKKISYLEFSWQEPQHNSMQFSEQNCC